MSREISSQKTFSLRLSEHRPIPKSKSNVRESKRRVEKRRGQKEEMPNLERTKEKREREEEGERGGKGRGREKGEERKGVL